MVFPRGLGTSIFPQILISSTASTLLTHECFLQIPVYIWSPEEEGLFKPGRCSRWWLHQSLKAFQKDLAALGTSMVYRRSQESCMTLVQLVKETGAEVWHRAHLLCGRADA